jgi:acyl-CoA hydrolase
VAIDDDGLPAQVPPLVAETLEEQGRMDAAEERQKTRLAKKADQR